MKNPSNIMNIFSGNINMLVYGKASNFLALTISMQSRLLVVHLETLFLNKSLDFHSEFTSFLINIMHARKRHIVSIPTIVKTETFCNASHSSIKFVSYGIFQAW